MAAMRARLVLRWGHLPLAKKGLTWKGAKILVVNPRWAADDDDDRKNYGGGLIDASGETQHLPELPPPAQSKSNPVPVQSKPNDGRTHSFHLFVPRVPQIASVLN